MGIVLPWTQIKSNNESINTITWVIPQFQQEYVWQLLPIFCPNEPASNNSYIQHFLFKLAIYSEII